MHGFYFDRSEERLALAKEAADMALRIGPSLPDAHHALGQYYFHGSRDYERALQEYAIALQINPNNAHVLAAKGYVEWRQGYFESALENLLKALELDPRSSALAHGIGNTYFWMRRYHEAEQSFDRAVLLAPDQTLPYVLKARLRVSRDGTKEKAWEALEKATRTIEPHMLLDRNISGSWALVRVLYEDSERALAELLEGSVDIDPALYHLVLAELSGRMNRPDLARAYYDSARAVLESTVTEHPDDALVQSELALAYAGLGSKDEAIQAGTRAVEILPLSKDALDGTNPVAYLAQVYLMTGEPDAATAQLENLLSRPGWLSTHWLRADPIWDPLRKHPRFRALLGREQ